VSILELEQITMRYPGAAAPCLRNLSLDVEAGEVVTLLGASGCGKTTLLKIVAGLEAQDEGQVRIDGTDMRSLAPEKRPIAMVFQKPLLFENMNVEQNVNFSPRMNRTMGKEELREKTRRMLELVGLEGFEKRRVSSLSGGQEQRVSLARALMAQPRLLLLDEPLSALDRNLKLSMEQMIRYINRELGTTMLYVTHDQNEAAAVSDRIALMREGQILQIGKAEDFYSHPVNAYTARFFGCGNLLKARKTGNRISSSLGDFSMSDCRLLDGEVLLGIRPEAAKDFQNGS
jgi:ABC-type Fe3+/spermidine/putrescine transport system ATPase subunit